MKKINNIIILCLIIIFCLMIPTSSFTKSKMMTYYLWIVPTSINSTPSCMWVESQENYELEISKRGTLGDATYWINLRIRWDEDWSKHSIIESLGPFTINQNKDIIYDLKEWKDYFKDGNIREYIIEIKIIDEYSSKWWYTHATFKAWHTEWDDWDENYTGYYHAEYIPIPFFKTSPK